MDMIINSPVPQSRLEAGIHHRIIYLFPEGISRFLSVIDGNIGYDTLLSHHLSEAMKAEFSDSVPLDTRRDRAIASGRKHLRKINKSWMMPSFDGFSCFGATRNNIQEFEFFETICAPLSISVSGANYKFAEKQATWELTPAQIEARDEIERKIENFYNLRDLISPGLVRQFNIYSTAFYKYLVAFTSPGAVWPKCVVIANDHSPDPVAFSMVLKGLGIPRIYLQHAEVSEAFPPLDFEHSVLRNEKSLETYSSIAEVRGATYVIPRFADLPKIEALEAPLEEPVKIVLYPTARILGPEIQSLVGKLLDNPLVHEVAVKEHPNASIRVADWVHDDRLQFVKEIPSGPHVAIVGNSSIAVELVSRAIPVYQNFDFDPVTRDYYGLVRAGLVPEVTSARLGDRFWEPYVLDETWRRTFSKWVPAAADGNADRDAFLRTMESLARRAQTARPAGVPKARAAQKQRQPDATGRRPRSSKTVARLSAALARVSPSLHAQLYQVRHYLLGASHKGTAAKKRKAPAKVKGQEGGSHSIQEKQIEYVASALSGARDPLVWLGQNEKFDIFSPLIVIRAVDLLIQQRDVSASNILRENPEMNPRSLTYLWLELKRAERSNLPVTAERLGHITEQIARDVCSPPLKRAIERALLPALINYGTTEQLIQFLEADLSRWQKFPLPSQVAFLRRLASSPAERGRAEKLRAQMLASATEFDRLKIANAEFFAGNAPLGWSHAHAERIFMTVAPEAVRTQYAAEVLPIFEMLRPRMTLMDMRTNPQQKASFLSRIHSALTDLEGFSCIRLSDGEGYLFPEAGYFGQEDSLNRERHWWGLELSKAQRSAIKLDASQAVRDADILGLPSVFRFIRDTASKTRSLTTSVQGRGLLSCLHGVADLALSDKVAFSEDKFNVALFGSVEVVLHLAAAARKVVVVSSIQPEFLPQGLREIPQIEYVLLPTHNNTKNSGAYVQGELPFPTVYPDLLDEFERKVERGTLVLVAGGIIGKIFIGRAKERGAVALDIGHVIDDWIVPKLTTLR